MTRILLENSVFSRPFNNLRFFGAWVVDSRDPIVVKGYSFYKTLMTILAIGGCTALFVDFYCVFGHYKDMTWNVCVNAMFTGSVLKNICVVHRSNIMSSLRRKLHHKATSSRTPEDEHLNRTTEKEMIFVLNMFHVTTFLVVSLWVITWYFSYPRSLPVPIRIPLDYDLEDELQYNLVFFSVAGAGTTGITFVVENELSMFAILIQISREYKRLLRDIRKINDLYEGDAKESGEVNPRLRNLKTKSLVKEYSTCQKQLIEYTNDFERSYSYSMVIQVFVLVLLVIVVAMLCILDFSGLSVNLSYLLGYIFVLQMDMFLLCSMCAQISDQCRRVGEEVYSALWYRMSPDIRKDLCMMIMRSQKPPKITSGKMMELNLRAYMVMMRNIYSWLALFQQLTFKTNK